MIGLHPLAPWDGLGHAAIRRLRAGWDTLGTAVDALAFPRVCPICDGDADHTAFCSPCRLELLEAAGATCPRCAMPVGPHARLDRGCSECRGRSLGFDAAAALGPYSGPIRSLCLRLKHERNAWLARWVGEVVAEARRPDVEALIRDRAWVVPVPLHWRKRLQRGYNQAEALARGLARPWGLPVRPALRRHARTEALARAGRAERARIMRDAFAVRRGHRAGLAGRSVVLVDDILTSGATAGAAARALKRAGAARVAVVVVGRAEGQP